MTTCTLRCVNFFTPLSKCVPALWEWSRSFWWWCCCCFFSCSSFAGVSGTYSPCSVWHQCIHRHPSNIMAAPIATTTPATIRLRRSTCRINDSFNSEIQGNVTISSIFTCTHLTTAPLNTYQLFLQLLNTRHCHYQHPVNRYKQHLWAPYIYYQFHTKASTSYDYLASYSYIIRHLYTGMLIADVLLYSSKEWIWPRERVEKQNHLTDFHNYFHLAQEISVVNISCYAHYPLTRNIPVVEMHNRTGLGEGWGEKVCSPWF